MKKSTLIAACAALLLSSCASEYNQVYKSATPTYKYEYAKQCFAQGKYSRAIPLLQEVVTMKKGSTEGEECLYMLAMAEYGLKDYETASEYFKKYFTTYPKGQYAEMAKYFVGESLYQNAPEPRPTPPSLLSRSSWTFIQMLASRRRPPIVCLPCKTSWWKRSIRAHVCITTWALTSVIAPMAETTTRLAS